MMTYISNNKITLNMIPNRVGLIGLIGEELKKRGVDARIDGYTLIADIDNALVHDLVNCNIISCAHAVEFTTTEINIINDILDKHLK